MQFSVLLMGLACSIFSTTCQAKAYKGKKTLEIYGDITQIALPVFAGLYSLWIEDYDGLKQLGWSAATTLVSVYGIKYAVNGPRPNNRDHGFPSAHTSGAFTGASYLHVRYGWRYGVPAYVGASLVGYSRVNAEQHYWADVIGGAVIATLVSYWLVKPFENTHLAEKLSFSPQIKPFTRSFAVTANFVF